MEKKPDSICFLDKDRVCGEDCRAYNLKNQRCKIVDSLVKGSSGFRQILKWAESHDVPRIG